MKSSLERIAAACPERFRLRCSLSERILAALADKLEEVARG